MPDLPNISAEFIAQYNAMSCWADINVKADGTMPAGTQIDAEIYSTLDKKIVATKTNIGLGKEHFSFRSVSAVSRNVLRLTITAHCEGYNPSIFTTSTNPFDSGA